MKLRNRFRKRADDVHRSLDGRVDLAAEVEAHGKDRLRELQDMVRSGELVEDLGKATRNTKTRRELAADDWEQDDSTDKPDSNEGTKGPKMKHRELIGKAYGLDIDDLPEDVQAALDELVDDNLVLSKGYADFEEEVEELRSMAEEAEDWDEEPVTAEALRKAEESFARNAPDQVAKHYKGRIEDKAAELRETDSSLTVEGSIAKAIAAHPELWEKWKEARRRPGVAVSKRDVMSGRTPEEEAMAKSRTAIHLEAQRQAFTSTVTTRARARLVEDVFLTVEQAVARVIEEDPTLKRQNDELGLRAQHLARLVMSPVRAARQ